MMAVQQRTFASDGEEAVAGEVALPIARARAAQARIEHHTREQADRLIRAMVWSIARADVARKIARFRVGETQLGNFDGKYMKISRKTRATPTNGDITWRDLINETWVSRPLATPGQWPTDEALFGDVIAVVRQTVRQGRAPGHGGPAMVAASCIYARRPAEPARLKEQRCSST